MAELVYAYASGAYGETLEGSSPSMPTLVRLRSRRVTGIVFCEHLLP